MRLDRAAFAEVVRTYYRMVGWDEAGRPRYETLLDHYWHNVDPFVSHRQFCDVGSQYRPAIFVRDAAQRAAAEQSKAALQQRFKEPILVEITDETAFYPAEDYHQDYYQRNSAQYRFYRYGCGRDRRLEAIWGEAH